MFLEIYPCRMSDLLVYNCLQYFLMCGFFFFWYLYFLMCVYVLSLIVSLLSFSSFIYLKSLYIDEPGWRLINFAMFLRKQFSVSLIFLLFPWDSLFPLWVLLLHSFCWFGFCLFFFFLIPLDGSLDCSLEIFLYLEIGLY